MRGSVGPLKIVGSYLWVAIEKTQNSKTTVMYKLKPALEKAERGSPSLKEAHTNPKRRHPPHTDIYRYTPGGSPL